MGNVSADGRQLWLSGRYDDVVYIFVQILRKEGNRRDGQERESAKET